MLLPNLLNLQIEEMLSLSSRISYLWKLREATIMPFGLMVICYFQGREKDVVIMSCVRANEDHRKSIG